MAPLNLGTRGRRLGERVRGRLDAARLARECDWYPAAVAALDSERARLASRHATYCSTVSTAEMALSLETAALLAATCRALRPRRVLDLGSGFSSGVVRELLAEGVVGHVVSVDDDEAWLDRTRAYLADRGLSTDATVTWADFVRSGSSDFTLVLHDLGSMRTRAAVLDDVLARTASGGYVVLDDVHKAEYREHAWRTLASHVCVRRSLHATTFDAFGRYAWLARTP